MKTMLLVIVFFVSYLAAQVLQAVSTVEEHKGHDHVKHENKVQDERRNEDDHENSEHEEVEDHQVVDHVGCGDEHGHESENEHNHSEHETQIHDEHEEDEHEGHDHSEHAAQNKESGSHEQESCDDGHNHAEENKGEEANVLTVSAGMRKKIGLQISKSGKGRVRQYAMLPAEVKLNANKSAEIASDYGSSVRQIFVDIGDEVREGDILASLKNRSTLSIYTVSSPINGVVISKATSLGELVDEGEMIFEVADLSSVWVDVHVFPKYRHLVKKGQDIEFIAADNHSAQGKIDYISPIVSKDTRTFTARCVLEYPTVDFLPGAFIKGRIEIFSKEYAVCVERSAVQTIEGENVIFVENENGFAPLVVKLGAKDDKMVEIQSGLHAGESYVSHGAFSLKAEIVTSGIDPHAGHGH